MSTQVPGGASGTGQRYEDVCVEGLRHATIVREEWDGSFVSIKNVGPCTCVEHDVFPQLLKALKL